MGAIVGARVGICRVGDGVITYLLVGGRVGDLEGVGVGGNDGALVVGHGEGAIEGAAEGTTEGTVVGAAVGAEVGISIIWTSTRWETVVHGKQLTASESCCNRFRICFSGWPVARAAAAVLR